MFVFQILSLVAGSLIPFSLWAGVVGQGGDRSLVEGISPIPLGVSFVCSGTGVFGLPFLP